MLRGGVKKTTKQNKNKKKKENEPRGGVRKGKKKKTKVGRGPFEQCVGDFCSAPRGGVKGKWRNRSRTDRALPVGRGRLVPRGGVRGKRKKKRFGRGPFVQQVWGFILFSLSLEKEKTHT